LGLWGGGRRKSTELSKALDELHKERDEVSFLHGTLPPLLLWGPLLGGPRPPKLRIGNGNRKQEYYTSHR